GHARGAQAQRAARRTRPEREDEGDRVDLPPAGEVSEAVRDSPVSRRGGAAMQARKLTVAGAVLLGFVAALLSLTGAAAPADEEKIIVPKEIAAAVNNLADEVGKGNKIDEQAAAYFKKHKDDLKQTMWIFKPREGNGNGGIGVGKPGQYAPDGIEGVIIVYG